MLPNSKPRAVPGRDVPCRAMPPFSSISLCPGVYLSLLPSLLRLGRPDLALASVCCALLALWPSVLHRMGRTEFYMRNRDYLLLIQ